MIHSVGKELDRLVVERTIEPVQFADLAAPIVPVFKQDKVLVRIGGDFKLTVNQSSKLDHYPIPRMKTYLQSSWVTNTWTFSQTYQQLLLDNESKDYVMINTHHRLFR